MTDLEITRLCAEAMGLEYTYLAGNLRINPYHNEKYAPLHDDAQMAQLGKSDPELFEAAVSEWASMKRCGELNANLNRVVCEAFAKMRATGKL